MPMEARGNTLGSPYVKDSHCRRSRLLEEAEGSAQGEDRRNRRPAGQTVKLPAKRILATGVVLLAGAAAVFAVRQTASLRTLYELDTRLWFLELKIRGDIPQTGWTEALRRVGPGWPQRARFDVAREVGRGAAPCPVLWETPLGRFWGTERDARELDLLMLEQAGGDIYEQRAVSVRDSDVVIDVGAHLGTFTRIALRHGARQVVAVEPDPVNAACFARTFAPEIAAGRVRLVVAAAWHSQGSLNVRARQRKPDRTRF